jgi:hypothetical protein
MRNVVQSVASGILAVSVLGAIALAQTKAVASTDGVQITGRVVDILTLPLARTTVTLIPAGSDMTSRAVLTDGDGRFAFPSVAPQRYELRLDARGFKAITIRLGDGAIGQDINIGTVVLQIGEVMEGPVSPVKISKQVKPVTVCDVLADLRRFGGKAIMVVGRLDRRVSLADSTCYLAEDRCERQVTIEGNMWPNKILVWGEWEKGMPRPPRANPQMDYAAVLQKISAISINTTLGFHREPLLKAQGRTIVFSQMGDVRDNWGVAYGRLVAVSKGKKFGCGDGDSCEGFDGAPAVLIINPESLHTFYGDNVQPRPAKK